MVYLLGCPGRKLEVDGSKVIGSVGCYKPQMIPMDINIGDFRVWGLESGPNLQPCISCWTRGVWLTVVVTEVVPFVSFGEETKLKYVEH